MPCFILCLPAIFSVFLGRAAQMPRISHWTDCMKRERATPKQPPAREKYLHTLSLHFSVPPSQTPPPTETLGHDHKGTTVTPTRQVSSQPKPRAVREGQQRCCRGQRKERTQRASAGHSVCLTFLSRKRCSPAMVHYKSLGLRFLAEQKGQTVVPCTCVDGLTPWVVIKIRHISLSSPLLGSK